MTLSIKEAASKLLFWFLTQVKWEEVCKAGGLTLFSVRYQKTLAALLLFIRANIELLGKVYNQV